MQYAQSLDEVLGSGDLSVRDLWKELEVETSSPMILLLHGLLLSSLKVKGSASQAASDERWTDLKTVYDPGDFQLVTNIPVTPGVGDEG